MPSAPPTPTTLGRVEKQGAGSNNATWGDTHLNDALTRLTEMAQGVARVTVSGAYTLASNLYVADEARMSAVIGTGSGGTLTINSEDHNYIVANRCTGPLTVTTGAGRTVTLPAGFCAFVLCDGANVDFVQDLTARAYTDAKVLTANAGNLPGGALPGGYLYTNPTTGAAEWRVPIIGDVTGLAAALAAQQRLSIAFAAAL